MGRNRQGQSIFHEPRLKDPKAARHYFESLRWPNGPACPCCGATNRIGRLQGKAYRPGLYACDHCYNLFTVTVGTVFESTRIPLHKWIMAATLLAAQKGITGRQLQRMLGVAYATAWLMSHRLRKAMKSLPEVDAKTLKRVDKTLLRMLSARPQPLPRASKKGAKLGSRNQVVDF